MAKALDARWKSWLHTNIARKCDPEELLGTLLKNGFKLDAIRAGMGPHYPARSPTALAAGEAPPPPVDYAAVAATRIARDSGLGAKRLDTERAQIFTLDDFMSAAECEAIARLIDGSLRPSTLTRQSRADKAYRTSRTSDLSLLKDPAVAALDRKIAAAVGIRLPYSEGIQGQRYDVGQEFREHTDYFAPESEEMRAYGRDRGNRTWTFMVYLNDVESGGGTSFVRLNQVVVPRQGRALAWNNLLPGGKPNPDTLHAGLPVETGHKLVITKWFREMGDGPMFYDDPG